jgi:hypothetical protein
MQDGDQAVVAAQLERPVRAPVDVEWRGCPFDLPVVVRVPSILDDGTPFPTRYWLSCPLAVRRIGRLESAGGVRSMERRSRHDPHFGRRLATPKSGRRPRPSTPNLGRPEEWAAPEPGSSACTLTTPITGPATTTRWANWWPPGSSL